MRSTQFPLWEEEEKIEVSHVVYCCTGKWLLVGSLMNEIGKAEQTRNELASFLIMFCKYLFVIDYMQSVYWQVF